MVVVMVVVVVVVAVLLMVVAVLLVVVVVVAVLVVVVVVVVMMMMMVSARLACLFFISCIFHNDHFQLYSTETHFSSHRPKFTTNSGKGKSIAKTVQTIKVYGVVEE
jgi:hypothetical protein